MAHTTVLKKVVDDLQSALQSKDEELVAKGKALEASRAELASLSDDIDGLVKDLKDVEGISSKMESVRAKITELETARDELQLVADARDEGARLERVAAVVRSAAFRMKHRGLLRGWMTWASQHRRQQDEGRRARIFREAQQRLLKLEEERRKVRRTQCNARHAHHACHVCDVYVTYVTYM